MYKNNIDFIDHLKRGDEKAYVYLVETYHKPLFNYVLSLNADRALAEDIIQTVFLKTWEYRKRLNPNYSLKSFLYTSTYNEFINQYHKHRAFSILEKKYIEALDEVVSEIDNKNLLEQKIALLNRGIDLLPPKCKETFLLSKKEGLTNIEISEYLNVSIKTVEAQLTKAYKVLKNKIGKQLKSMLFLLFGKVNRVKL
ncbi:RNA polymerase sigma-70 factor [Polaribacter filamentus]|uniref:RNA polymerase sigma-70 factor n=1 Tax=Polaribacter filamentus TaxID=53483 RepID=A0A2S7L2I0_9FLAO|nr:sigma-70 family RNA polymerase sigma factor [Polaribacter filamentus]PQB09077.1 RNA polymerase sigma-70 factor [Polaribacter filamentus]